MTGPNKKLISAVEAYFTDMGRVHASGGGTGERSYYPALANLLCAVGDTLKPKVFCVLEGADQGAGHPDYALYTAKQVQKGRPREGQVPERGVVEVKGVEDDACVTASIVARPITWMTSSLATSVCSTSSSIGSRNCPSRFRNSLIARLSARPLTSYVLFIVVAPCWGFCLPEPIGPGPLEPPLFFLPYQEPSTTVGTASAYPGWSIWLQLSRPRTASELLLYAETSSLIRLNFSTTGLTLSKNHSLKRGDSPGR